MSVIRMLSRLCAVAALRGRTWADERVFDSDNTPLSQALMLNEAAKPYIVVYTDADNRLDIGGTDLYSVRREMSLVLELGVASKVEGATGGVQLKTPLTDEGMEIALDMVEEQSISALFGDPMSDWAELLKLIVIKVDRVSGQRGASAERDKRWAARQLTFVCDTLADLPPGVPVPYGHPIQQFTEVSKNNPEAGMDHASEICTALINRTAAPEWRQMQAMLGIRRLGLRAIGLAPLAADLPTMATAEGDDLTDTRGEAPILREISADDMQMENEPDKGLVDLQTIRTNVLTGKVVEKKDKVEIEGEQS
jgi:hypothetical protein